MKTMKHATLISLSLLAVVCSCTKVDVRTTEQPEREICFSEPVVSTMTKAVTGEINGLYPVDESFGVFSVYHVNEFTSWTDGTAYIKGSEFTYNASLMTPTRMTSEDGQAATSSRRTATCLLPHTLHLMHTLRQLQVKARVHFLMDLQD